MDGSTRRRRLLLSRYGMLTAALVACGCDGSSSRVFSATVLEPATIECEARVLSSEVDEEDIEALAKQERRQWKQDKERIPPTPQGRVLHIIEVGSSMRAWFETSNSGFSNTTGNGAVFAGDIQENVIEGDLEVLFNTDDSDEEDGYELCGDRPLRIGKLLATDADGAVLGRINWQEITYINSSSTQCAATVVCTRNVDLWGGEQP